MWKLVALTIALLLCPSPVGAEEQSHVSLEAFKSEPYTFYDGQVFLSKVGEGRGGE